MEGFICLWLSFLLLSNFFLFFFWHLFSDGKEQNCFCKENKKICLASMLLRTESEESAYAQVSTFPYRFYQNLLSYVPKSSSYATDLVAFQWGVTWFLNVYYYTHPRNQAKIPHYNFSSCKASLKAVFPTCAGTQMWQFNSLDDHTKKWLSGII